MRHISSIIMRIMGWKLTKTRPIDKKAIVIAAPHTSAWDFFIGKLAFSTFGIKINLLMKKEYFNFILGPILRSVGAIAVDRGNRNSNLLGQIVNEFKNRDEILLVITPEGSRKKRDKWKRGFYEIAMAANVPIYIGKLDYKKKTCDLGERFIPSGDFAKDIEYIQTQYKDVNAKYPELFSWGERFYGKNNE